MIIVNKNEAFNRSLLFIFYPRALPDKINTPTPLLILWEQGLPAPEWASCPFPHVHYLRGDREREKHPH
jgi:hypothetical protein